MSDLKLTAEETAIWDREYHDWAVAHSGEKARELADEHIRQRRARLEPTPTTNAPVGGVESRGAPLERATNVLRLTEEEQALFDRVASKTATTKGTTLTASIEFAAGLANGIAAARMARTAAIVNDASARLAPAEPVAATVPMTRTDGYGNPNPEGTYLSPPPVVKKPLTPAEPVVKESLTTGETPPPAAPEPTLLEAARAVIDKSWYAHGAVCGSHWAYSSDTRNAFKAAIAREEASAREPNHGRTKWRQIARDWQARAESATRDLAACREQVKELEHRAEVAETKSAKRLDTILDLRAQLTAAYARVAKVSRDWDEAIGLAHKAINERGGFASRAQTLESERNSLAGRVKTLEETASSFAAELTAAEAERDRLVKEVAALKARADEAKGLLAVSGCALDTDIPELTRMGRIANAAMDASQVLDGGVPWRVARDIMDAEAAALKASPPLAAVRKALEAFRDFMTIGADDWQDKYNPACLHRRPAVMALVEPALRALDAAPPAAQVVEAAVKCRDIFNEPGPQYSERFNDFLAAVDAYLAAKGEVRA